MTTTHPDLNKPDPKQQRDALTESERKAAEEQPDSFKEEAMTDKVVEIPPITKDGQPIKGLDPKT